MSISPDWLKAIQLKPRFLFGLFILGVVILKVPDSYAKIFGITDLLNQYRGWIGVGTLAALCFWFVQLWPWLWKQINSRKRKSNILKNINNLTEKEHRILAYCLTRNERTINLDIINPEGLSLCNKGLLAKAQGVGDMLEWPYTMPSFVWDHLQDIREEFLGRFSHPNDIPGEGNW
ncbi:MAG: super-infection exclusion protein B [bacterium]